MEAGEEERAEPMGERAGPQPPTLLLHPQVTQLPKYLVQVICVAVVKSLGQGLGLHQLSGSEVPWGGPEWR